MPTISDLKDGIKSELSSRLLGGNPVLPQSNLDDIAAYVAFLQFANEKACESMESMLTPLTAVGSQLDQWGGAFGVTRLMPTPAVGTVTVSGVSGSTLPAGTILTRCDGFEYVTTENVTLTGSTGSVPVEATESGATGNYTVSGELNIGSVSGGFQSIALVEIISGGSENECDDDLRQRILTAIRSPCRVGTKNDYEFWALQYPGVTRVCCVDQPRGCGTVDIYVMMDNSYVDGFPLGSDIELINESIFGSNGLAPLGVCGEVLAPTNCPVDITVSNVGTVSAEEFDAVLETLQSSFLDFFNCAGQTVCRADIEIVLRKAFPEGCYNLIEPSENVQIECGCVPTVGVLTIA